MVTLKSIKFLCSYGGRILPRYPDGKLRYHGGDTRVLSVDSSISFSELLQKMGEMCGSSVTLRCQFPTEDLDALVSITSDEDLAYLIEEYYRAAAALPSSIKIRAFLSVAKQVSPPPSAAASPKSPFDFSAVGGGRPPRCPTSAARRCLRRPSRPPLYPTIHGKAAGKIGHKYGYQHHHHVHGNSGGRVFLIQPLAIAEKFW
ncbi:hypothetical protein BUALT_Bualt17G0034600 [Buddleja alternifolia]|uniref:PB1 domain-containing protein n=1 Tax=Buddleja alternifolia TaxID=168488 RepID=A0AAV6W7E8_9LAMI|nr:hypothetical protein BUALT_Bualt17G0034600 [Buddleja alternifolia]